MSDVGKHKKFNVVTQKPSCYSQNNIGTKVIARELERNLIGSTLSVSDIFD